MFRRLVLAASSLTVTAIALAVIYGVTRSGANALALALGAAPGVRLAAWLRSAAAESSPDRR